MVQKKRKPITEQALSDGEAQAYKIEFDDGVKHVLDRLSVVDPDRFSDDARDIVKTLIIANALESVDSQSPN